MYLIDFIQTFISQKAHGFAACASVPTNVGWKVKKRGCTRYSHFWMGPWLHSWSQPSPWC